jgi:thioredoxin 1
MEMVLGGGFLLLIVLIFLSGDPRSEWSASRRADSEAPEENPHIVTLTEANWQTEVVDSTIPVVVDFWAPWCGPCRKLSKHIDRVATRFAGKVKVGKLNVDDAPEIARRYGASSIPLVCVFYGGDQPRSRMGGYRPDAEEHIADMVSSFVK